MKKIFLVDAIGATVSVIFLCALYSFEELFGMPKDVLRILIIIALLLTGYSLICYFSNLTKWRLFLAIIAILNIGYGLFTIYCIVQHSNKIRSLGYLYFIAELSILLTLSSYELHLSRKRTH